MLDLLFCGSWDLGQLSLSVLPPSLFLLPPPPTPPSTTLEAHCVPKGTSSKEGFHNFIIYFLFPSLSLPISGQTSEAAPWDIPASSSCSSFQQLGAVCPYMSRVLSNHRKRQFKQICYCCRSHQRFGTNWGIWSQSMASAHTLSDKQYSSVQATRKPQNKGNPCLCSVGWAVTVK